MPETIGQKMNEWEEKIIFNLITIPHSEKTDPFYRHEVLNMVKSEIYKAMQEVCHAIIDNNYIDINDIDSILESRGIKEKI